MKLSFKQTWSEFKAFAFKGSMIDLAVAVVIGGAFSSVINSLVADVIMPSLSYVTSGVKTVESTAANVGRDVGFPLHAGASQPAAAQPTATAAAPASTPPPAPGTAQPVDFHWHIGRIDIGHFIGSLLSFILVAFAVYLMMVKMLGSVKRHAGLKSDGNEPLTKECPECLSIIPAKAKRCAHCTAILSVDS